MGQLHEHFSDEQVAFLFQAYSRGLMSRIEVQETLSYWQDLLLWPVEGV